jgi:hypothetical protein
MQCVVKHFWIERDAQYARGSFQFVLGIKQEIFEAERMDVGVRLCDFLDLCLACNPTVNGISKIIVAEMF